MMHLARTRKSILDGVKLQLPNCDTSAIVLEPIGGVFQCKWANEFATAGR